jgi:hypothetical protein
MQHADSISDFSAGFEFSDDFYQDFLSANPERTLEQLLPRLDESVCPHCEPRLLWTLPILSRAFAY